MKKLNINLKMFVVVIGVLMLFSFSTYAQITNAEKKISSVKVDLETRKKLVERLNTYIKYNQEKDYEKQFQLSTESQECTVCKDERNEFLAEQKRLAYINGEILEAKILDIDRKLDKKEQSLTIKIKLKLYRKRNDMFLFDSTYWFKCFFWASLKKGQWYFSRFFWINV